MKLYTLIHVAKDKNPLGEEDFALLAKRITPYFLCAVQLHRSLKPAGVELSIITNDKEIFRRLNTKNYPIEFIELNFSMEVPKEIKFYSAHYKIETYKYLASLKEDYIGLVDCDVTCISGISNSIQRIIDQKLPLYYDITDQMAPAFGMDRIIRDKEMITGTSSVGLWAGGEFISGTPEFFGSVYKEIEDVKEQYFVHCKKMFHEGDEMLTSIAIENLMKKGTPIFEAGNLGIITRFWSINSRHHQKSFNAYTDCFLLHLPADKEFLSSIAEADSNANFLRKYKQHLFKRKPRRITSNLYRTFFKSSSI